MLLCRVLESTFKISDCRDNQETDCRAIAWPALAKTLGVQVGPDVETSVATYLKENEDVWNRIVAKHDLRSKSLREFVGHGDQHADFAFALGAPAGPRAFVSTIKLRQAGFTKTVDTELSFSAALRSLIDRKFLPAAAR